MSYEDQEQDDSVFLYHTECPDRGLRMPMAFTRDGHMYCFACDPSVAWKKGDMELTEGYTPSGGKKQVSNLLTW
ncbi:primase/helicase protein [Enterobacter phage 02_vB_Eclo_IJM]|nr:primase/helicase protein [Enterobacter phage 02_vB_Eclo_IJM]